MNTAPAVYASSRCKERSKIIVDEKGQLAAGAYAARREQAPRKNSG
jgi:hypothetical protein